MKQAMLVLFCLMLFGLSLNLGGNGYSPPEPIAPTEQVQPADLPVGYEEIAEHSSRTYLGNGQWRTSPMLGETNAWNGTHYVRYIYNPSLKTVTIGKLTFTHESFGDIHVEHSGSGLMIDRIRWYAQYYYNSAWQNFTFDNYQFVGFTKTDSNVSVNQRWWSTQGELNVTYTYNWQHALKMNAKATNWAAATVPVRIIWAALGIEMAGVDFYRLVENNVTTGVQIGEQQLTWSDVIGNTPEIAINPVLDKDNQRAGIVFGNMSSTLATGQTMVIDPEYKVSADSDDTYWKLATSNTNTPDSTLDYVEQFSETATRVSIFRIALSIPNGATIDTATCTFVVNARGAAVQVGLLRITEINLGSVEADTELPTPTYTNYITFTFPAVGSYTTASIAAMVQDEVNDGSWASGYYMGFYFEDESGTVATNNIWDYQGSSTNAPHVDITYHNAPVNTATPYCYNPSDGNNLYARFGYYIIMNITATDGDGYADITYIELSCIDSTKAVVWTQRYTESGNVFSETAGTSYIEQLTGLCSWSKSGDEIEISFAFNVEWAHPDSAVTNGPYDLKLYVIDDSSYSDTDEYLSIDYDYETRLDFASDPVLTDGLGTLDRGNYSTVGQITTGANSATYCVGYEGFESSRHPPATEVDVWVTCPDTPDTDWNATDYEETGGTWHVHVDSDDVVGLDTYTMKVTAQDAGSGATDQCGATHTDTYIADRIKVMAYNATAADAPYVKGWPTPRIVVNDTLYWFYVWLQYEYDSANVTTGSFTVSGWTCTYMSGGSWKFNPTWGSLGPKTYDTVAGADTTHGVSNVNQNSKSLNVIWEGLKVISYTAVPQYQMAGQWINLSVHLHYAYGGENCEAASGGITFNGVGYHDWEDGNGNFGILLIEYTEGNETYDTIAGLVSEPYYIWSGNGWGPEYGGYIDQNGQSITIYWGGVKVSGYSTSPVRADLGASAYATVTLVWSFNDSAISTADYVYIDGLLCDYVSGGDYKLHSGIVYWTPTSTVLDTVTCYIDDEWWPVNQNSQSATLIWEKVKIYVTANMTWCYVGYYVNIYGDARYMYDNSTTTGYFYINSTYGQSLNYTFGTIGQRAFLITGFDDTGTYDITNWETTTVYVVWDEMTVPSISYYWTQYDVETVWLHIDTAAWRFQYQNDPMSYYATGDSIINAYRNDTSNTYSVIRDTGSLDTLLVGPFSPSWYYANISFRWQATCQGRSYDIYCTSILLTVDIAHTIQITDSMWNPTDLYIYLGAYTNYGNATLTVWDYYDSVYTLAAFTASEGWLNIEIPTQDGVHQIVMLVNCSNTEGTSTHQYPDLSDSTMWLYLIQPITIGAAVAENEWSYIYTYNQGGDYVDWENFIFYINGTELATNQFYNSTTSAYNIVIKDAFGDTVYNQTADWDYTWRILLDIHSFKLVSELDGKILIRVTSSGGGYKETWLYWGEVYEWWLYANKDYQFYWEITESGMGAPQGDHYYPADGTWYSPGAAAMYVIDAFGMGTIFEKIPDPQGGGGISDDAIDKIAQSVVDDFMGLLNPLQGGILGVLILVGFIALAYMSYAVPTKVERRVTPKKPPEKGEQRPAHKAKQKTKRFTSRLKNKLWRK